MFSFTSPENNPPPSPFQTLMHTKIRKECVCLCVKNYNTMQTHRIKENGNTIQKRKEDKRSEKRYKNENVVLISWLNTAI